MDTMQRSDLSGGQGRATPGWFGYAVAIAVSLVTFAFEVAVLDAWEAGTLFELGELGEFLFLVLLVLFVGAVPAAVIGSVGALAVHLLTWRTRSQGWAVAGAALAGLVAGLVLYRDEFVPALSLAIAAGVGRLSVVRLAAQRVAAARDASPPPT